MKIPKKFVIKGKQWKVSWRKQVMYLGDECDGLADGEKRTIYLSKACDPSLHQSVFMHELVEAIIFELHLAGHDNSISPLAKEVLCDGVADIFLDLFTLEWRANE